MISCMGNEQSAPISIFGNWGALHIIQPQIQAGDSMGDQTRTAARPVGRGTVAVVKAEREFLNKFKEANNGKTEVTIEPQ